jgi:hypothetical protein
LVALFIVLALAMSGAFLFGMQKALSVGWRDAARPLLVDYVDRVAAEIGSPPSVQRAQAITQRLPVTVRISGPQVNWRSHPDDDEHRHRRDRVDGRPPRPGDDRLLMPHHGRRPPHRLWPEPSSPGAIARASLAGRRWPRCCC